MTPRNRVMRPRNDSQAVDWYCSTPAPVIAGPSRYNNNCFHGGVLRSMSLKNTILLLRVRHVFLSLCVCVVLVVVVRDSS